VFSICLSHLLRASGARNFPSRPTVQQYSPHSASLCLSPRSPAPPPRPRRSQQSLSTGTRLRYGLRGRRRIFFFGASPRTRSAECSPATTPQAVADSGCGPCDRNAALIAQTETSLTELQRRSDDAWGQNGTRQSPRRAKPRAQSRDGA
jgi:hypothetical protein